MSALTHHSPRRVDLRLETELSEGVEAELRKSGRGPVDPLGRAPELEPLRTVEESDTTVGALSARGMRQRGSMRLLTCAEL